MSKCTSTYSTNVKMCECIKNKCPTVRVQKEQQIYISACLNFLVSFNPLSKDRQFSEDLPRLKDNYEEKICETISLEILGKQHSKRGEKKVLSTTTMDAQRATHSLGAAAVVSV